MMQRQDIIPIGGLNTDDDPRHFEQGDYEAARNLHTGTTQAAGDEGLVSSIKSTYDREMFVDAGVNYLGVAKDEENDRAYLLLLVDLGPTSYEFRIVKHDLSDDTYKIIFQGDSEAWNISPWGSTKQKFYNPRIVDGRLIFTDNVNDIRQIDVEKMERTWDAGINVAATYWNPAYAFSPGYTAGDFVFYLDSVYEVLQTTVSAITPDNAPAYYDNVAAVVDVYLDPIDPNNFTLAALPPLIAATAEYLPTPSIAVNQLKGRTWQFSYQYVYMDYRKSTYAPPSLVPAPSQEETIDGAPQTDPSHNNTIRLTINTGNEQVRSIRLVARTSEDPSTWFVIDEIYVVNDKNNRVYGANRNIYVYFYNDKAGEIITSSEVFNLFHYVPVRAKHMELIEGNRLAFGNITEGYSRIGTQVDVSLSWQDLAGISTQIIQLNVIYVSSWISEDMFNWLLRFTIPTTNPGACQFQIYLNLNDGNGEILVYYDYNGTDSYPSTVTAGLLAAINAQWPGEAGTCFVPNSYQFCAFPRVASVWARPYDTWMYSFQYEISTVVGVDKVPQLKTGATHAWGLIYRDIAGRICPISGASEMTKYIPFPTESTDSNVNRKPIITFEINHLPPSQAVSYEVVYAGNKSTSWHLQLLGYNFAQGKKNHTDSSSFVSWPEYYRLRIKKAQANTRDNLLNWSVEEYVWQKGDRIRIIGKVSATGVLTEINDDIYDVEIMAVFTDYEQASTIGDDPHDATEIQSEWIYFPINSNLPSFIPATAGPPNAWPDNLLVEIYRPFTTETNLYFTTGMTFAIETDVYGNKFHKGNVDQVLNASGQPLTPASVTNTSHDNWKYLRNFRDVADSQSFPIWVESQYASDFYISQILTSQGNPIPNIDSQQQNVLTKRLRHGGQISIGSQSNLIAEFLFDDYLDLKDEHGPIEGMRLVGFVLKVIQYTKIVSVYISRQESFSASGDAQYLFTDKIFGSSRPSMENYGTQHPDSVIVHNRHLYFWDQSEGAVIRDAANGVIPISEYKMNRYFKDKADYLKSRPVQYEVYVNFGFSKATNELFCLFGYFTDTKEIISFSENDQRWKNQFDVDFRIGSIYWLGKRLFIGHGPYSYEWWAGTTYQSLTGQIRTSQLIVYANQDPMKVKVFNAIHVYQTGGDPEFNSITVPDKATSVDGEMETNVYPANIERKEGVFYCALLKDINTPGPQTQQWKELNGRDMRGLYCKIDMILRNSIIPTTKVTLSNLAVITTGSERSK